MRKVVFAILRGAGLIFLSIYFFLAFQSRFKPDLSVWHRPLKGELKARDIKPNWSLDDFLQHEEALFDHLEETIIQELPAEQRVLPNRFVKGSPSDPSILFERNWNKTQILTPSGDVRGGAVMIHGLTDSPYSMKTLAENLQAKGYYVLCMRMPGHGTTPGSLTNISWRDWYAALCLGIEHTSEVVGEGKSLYLFGYSNGGALALNYAFDSIGDELSPKVDKLFLLSPAVKVTRWAHVSGFNKLLSWIPYFEKFQWTDVFQEYDPYKYGSFCKNAARQSLLLSKQVLKKGARLRKKGKMDQLPPVITFQSVVDATVSAEAVKEFYLSMEPNGSELVLFDYNRFSPMQPFMNIPTDDLRASLDQEKSLPFTLYLMSNEDQSKRDLAIRIRRPGDSGYDQIDLTDLEWPSNVYAFSHIALPFRPDDKVYGYHSLGGASPLFRIGAVAPRGEKGLLRISMEHLMRLRCNPFFQILEERVNAHVE